MSCFSRERGPPLQLPSLVIFHELLAALLLKCYYTVVALCNAVASNLIATHSSSYPYPLLYTTLPPLMHPLTFLCLILVNVLKVRELVVAGTPPVVHTHTHTHTHTY